MKHTGTNAMQELGVHFMGSNSNYDTKEESKRIITNTISNIEIINTNDYNLIPTGMNVLIIPYVENPYMSLSTSNSGLIIGARSYGEEKNPESGERTPSWAAIAVGKVVSVGLSCKEVQPGDDVFYRNSIVPVPFGFEHNYEIISEPNIISRITKK